MLPVHHDCNSLTNVFGKIVNHLLIHPKHRKVLGVIREVKHVQKQSHFTLGRLGMLSLKRTNLVDYVDQQRMCSQILCLDAVAIFSKRIAFIIFNLH